MLRIQWTPVFFLGVGWLGGEVNQSPPSRAKIMNEWSHNSTFHTCLHVLATEKLTF